MQQIRLFKKGEIPTAAKLNVIAKELRRLQNITTDKQSSLAVTHTENGVFITNRPRTLLIDDKYLLDSNINASTRVRRKCDLSEADIADFFRIRARPGGEERPEGISKTLTAYLLMQLLNPIEEQGGEGGWVTDAGKGSDFEEINGVWQPAPPKRRVAQWGTLVQLTDDDVSIVTKDGDGFSLVNLRDDCHVHRSVAKDGRIYFTDTPAGALATGLHIVGEMVGDERLANFDTRLDRETVEWRPQEPHPGIEYSVFDWECYEPLNTSSYRFPPVLRIPSTSILGHEFVNGGKPAGYSGHAELHDIVEGQGMGFRIKYSASNPTGSPLNAYFPYSYKVINANGNLSTAGMALGSFTIPVPAGSTEQVVRYADAPIVPYSALLAAGRGCLIIFEYIVREFAHAQDTLVNRLLCTEWKPRLMIVPEPPV